MRLSPLVTSTLLSLLFLSCVSLKEGRVSFKYYENFEKKKITLNIPPGGKLIRILAGGEGEEHRYWFSDSSVIYISSLSGSATLNDSLIRRSGHYDTFFLSDTGSFAGVDDKGNFWEEVKRNKLVYGYSNVPSSKKSTFEKALISVK